MYLRLVNIVTSILLTPLLVSSQEKAEERIIVSVVQSFFDALSNQDTSALRKLFHEQSMTHYVHHTKDSVTTTSHPSSQINFSRGRQITEQMRYPNIEIITHQRIASAWIPYDLWINGKFSHCGIDVFTFIKTAEGWKITSLSFTREFDNCEE